MRGNTHVRCGPGEKPEAEMPEVYLQALGTVPEFEKKLATVRKYEISVSIILQSLVQLQNMYQKNWSELTGNCDTLVYLGGGADAETAKWLSGLVGKETRVVMNTTFGQGGGSTSLNRQGVELLAQSQVRTLQKTKCVVIPKSEWAWIGEKYDTLHHPHWKEMKKAGTFTWSEEKNQRLSNMRVVEAPVEEPPVPPSEPTIEEEERRDEVNREYRQRAMEMRDNRDAEGNPVVEAARPIGGEDSAFIRNVSVEEGPHSGLQEAVDTFGRNELIWKQMDIQYSSAPAETFSSSA